MEEGLDASSAVMFVTGWGMLENPPQPPLTVNALLNAGAMMKLGAHVRPLLLS
jgi:hypothetical protein